MSIISQETWDNMPEETKEKICKKYNWYRENEINEAILEFEDLFGKENLQPKPNIKTWEDVEKNREDEDACCCAIENTLSKSFFDDKLRNKLIATYKIAKLIELGYGGMVTEDEYILNEDSIEDDLWSVWINANGEIECTAIKDCRDFLVFHTQQQAEEFMSYPENRTLVEQYYMI